jgi:hypothetical protein
MAECRVGIVVPPAARHKADNGASYCLRSTARRSYPSISFSQWLRHSPPELVKAHFNLPDDTLNAIPRGKTVAI